MGGRTLYLWLILMVFAVVQSKKNGGQGKQIKYKIPQISWHGMQWLQLTMHACMHNSSASINIQAFIFIHVYVDSSQTVLQQILYSVVCTYEL